MDPGASISYNVTCHKIVFLFFFPQLFENVKAILSLQDVQKQVLARCGRLAVVCIPDAGYGTAPRGLGVLRHSMFLGVCLQKEALGDLTLKKLLCLVIYSTRNICQGAKNFQGHL